MKFETLPRIYPILDVECIQRVAVGRPLLSAICDYALEFANHDVSVLQYRAKHLSSREMLSHARELRRILPASVKLIMNDRADFCLAADFDGVHVGQDDLSVVAVRSVIGPDRIVGISTHNLDQFAAALETDADYLAIGPVFSTASKQNPDPVIGLEGVKSARELKGSRNDRRPLVAIGGITRANAAFVLQAGADSVAVISDLFNAESTSVEAFLAVLM